MGNATETRGEIMSIKNATETRGEIMSIKKV